MTIGFTSSFTEQLLDLTSQPDPEAVAFKARQSDRRRELWELRENLNDAFWTVPEAEHQHRHDIQSIIDKVDQQMRGIDRTIAALDLVE